MTASLHAPVTAPAGLVHLGVVYDRVDDLVARALPEIRSVLDEGGDVRVTVERSGVRELRHALGDDASRVQFPTPASAFAVGVTDYLASLRRELRRDRRTLLVGQYSTTTPPIWDSAQAEDAINLVFGDLPLTVLCACAGDGAPDHRAQTERSHPHLLSADGRVPNRGYRTPDPASPAPLAPWGPPLVTTTVRDVEGLATLRRRVTDVATDAGLTGESRDAAVLAVHEAVLLASGADPDLAVPLATAHEVEVRARDGALVTEVRTPAGRPGDDDGPDGPGARAHWRHDLLPRFCDRLATHQGPEGHRVRVLNDARSPLTPPAAPRTTGRPTR